MTQTKQLGELLSSVTGIVEVDGPMVEVRGIAYDSRRVQPGDLFVALPGERTSGHVFVQAALEAGAVGAVVAASVRGELTEAPADRALVVVEDTRRALAEIASALHGHPSRRLRLVGVTGTDGKTTTTHMIAHLLSFSGHRAGLLSTVAVQTSDRTEANTTSHTTPQAPEIQAALARMVENGAEVAVVEVSSHALALERVTGCEFDVAVFTNLTSEHLNFHRTLDDYRAAKARLFAMLAQSSKSTPRRGIVNADDPSAEAMAAASPSPVWRFSLLGHGDIVARNIQHTPTGLRFEVVTPEGGITAETKLRGRYNVANWLGAIGAALALGATPEKIAQAIPRFAGVPGRWQYVDAGQPFSVVVDFAHTPNGLTNILRELRAVTPGRLILVFGLPGGRDRANRPVMGAIAGHNADFAILTTDDPYDEDPAQIASEIEPGFVEAGRQIGQDYTRILDRREAIAAAIEMARPGDTILLAGRGHERFTTIRGKVVPFDDAAVALELLRARQQRPAVA